MRSWPYSLSTQQSWNAKNVWSVLAAAALVASRHVPCDVHAYAAAVWRKLLVITSAGLFVWLVGWLVWLVGWLGYARLVRLVYSFV